jgi:hypothetical protein
MIENTPFTFVSITFLHVFMSASLSNWSSKTIAVKTIPATGGRRSSSSSITFISFQDVTSACLRRICDPVSRCKRWTSAFFSSLGAERAVHMTVFAPFSTIHLATSKPKPRTPPITRYVRSSFKPLASSGKLKKTAFSGVCLGFKETVRKQISFSLSK